MIKIVILVIILLLLFTKTDEYFEPKRIYNVAVIIPCVPSHIQYLGELFESINNQTVLPKRVILALSETQKDSCNNTANNLRKNLDKRIKLIVNCSANKKNAAANRNRGLDNIKDCEYISYIDADDVMCPSRIEKTVELIKEYNADACLHSYCNSLDKCSTGNKVLSPEQVKNIEQDNRNHIHLTKIPLTHGHITITKNVIKNIKQNNSNEYRRMEDSKFVRDLFKNNFRVVHTEDTLSVYNYEKSAG